MGLVSITWGTLTNVMQVFLHYLEFHLNYNHGKIEPGLKSSTICLNYTNHFPTSGYISSVQIELYKIPSVFMNMNESPQKLKTNSR